MGKMKIKRIALLCLALSMVFSGTVFAGAEFSIDDPALDIVSVSDDNASGDTATIVVLNQGYDYNSYLNGDATVKNAALQYIGIAEVTDGAYEKSFRITGDGGIFSIYVNGGLIDNIEYYTNQSKQQFITDFINGVQTDVILLFKKLGFSSDPLFINADQSDIVTRVNNIENFPEDVTAAYNVLRDVLLLSAYNSHNSDVLLKDNKILYADVLGIADTDEYEDYTTVLKETAYEEFNEELLSGTYENLDDVTSKFNELFYLHAVINNKTKGYGHIQPLFVKYGTAYTDAGMRIPNKANKNMYQALLKADIDSLDDMVDFINSYEEESTSDNRGSNSSSHFGGGSSGGSSGGFVSLVDLNKQNQPIVSNGEFKSSDVSKDHWAYDAIGKLVEEKIVSGYPDGSFKPDNSVTRAEFIKMVVCLFGYEGGNADFADMSDKDWYAPFVKAAVSKGIIQGDGGLFRGNDVITRQDAAVVIGRALGVVSESPAGFSDAGNISEYAMPYVAALASGGIINGMGDGTYAPLQPITRAQTASMLLKVLEK